MFDLSKKVALVAGGAGYLGQAVCQKLAEQAATLPDKLSMLMEDGHVGKAKLAQRTRYKQIIEYGKQLNIHSISKLSHFLGD